MSPGCAAVADIVTIWTMLDHLPSELIDNSWLRLEMLNNKATKRMRDGRKWPDSTWIAFHILLAGWLAGCRYGCRDRLAQAQPRRIEIQRDDRS